MTEFRSCSWPPEVGAQSDGYNVVSAGRARTDAPSRSYEAWATVTRASCPRLNLVFETPDGGSTENTYESMLPLHLGETIALETPGLKAATASRRAGAAEVVVLHRDHTRLTKASCAQDTGAPSVTPDWTASGPTLRVIGPGVAYPSSFQGISLSEHTRSAAEKGRLAPGGMKYVWIDIEERNPWPEGKAPEEGQNFLVGYPGCSSRRGCLVEPDFAQNYHPKPRRVGSQLGVSEQDSEHELVPGQPHRFALSVLVPQDVRPATMTFCFCRHVDRGGIALAQLPGPGAASPGGVIPTGRQLPSVAPIQVPSKFVGDWYVRGRQLEIKADGRVSSSTNLGPCGSSGFGQVEPCRQIANYRLVPRRAPDALVGKVASVSYVDGYGRLIENPYPGSSS